MIDRILPHNTEAEEAIIASIIIDPKAIEQVASILDSEAFYVTQHSYLYKASLALYEQGLPIDLIQIEDWLRQHKQLNKAGGKVKINRLLKQNISTANINQYAAIVMDKYYRRKLIADCQDITAACYDETNTLSDIY